MLSDALKNIKDTSNRFTGPPVSTLGVSTSHYMAIKVNSSTIGMIQSWFPAQSRTVTPMYEINAAATGEISDNIPGNIGGLTVNITRFDLFKSRMEQVWGSLDLHMLTDQTNPLIIKESWVYPDSSVDIWAYTGCWFTSLGRNMSATGDRIVNVNATLVYKKKFKMLDSSDSLGNLLKNSLDDLRGAVMPWK